LEVLDWLFGILPGWIVGMFGNIGIVGKSKRSWQSGKFK
jgi:hypothetical protein